MRTFGLVGCGTLGTIIAEGIATSLNEHYCACGVLDPNAEAAKTVSEILNCPVCHDLNELLGCKPDILIEAAAPVVLKEITIPALKNCTSVLALSVGAFSDMAFYQTVQETAIDSGSKVYLPSGAIGGFDIMNAALFAGDLQSEIKTEKPPRALKSAPGFAGVQDCSQYQEVFFGSASEAIQKFPKNINVAVALGLATCGPDNTMVRICSDPELDRNRHTVTLKGSFGQAKIQVEPKPSLNPGSSSLAAYSVLALLKRMASPIQIG